MRKNPAALLLLTVAVVLFTMGTVVLTTIVTINTDGSAATPCITMGTTPDPDTGFYHPAANEVAVAGNGQNIITFRINDATHGTHFTGTPGNLNTICLTSVATDVCDPGANTGLFADPSQITFATAGAPSTGTILADPLVLSSTGASITLNSPSNNVTVASTTAFTINGAVASSTAILQVTGMVASTSPSVPFSIGPTAVFAAANIGMLVCTQRCTITKAWGMALTAGTLGSTNVTVTLTDGVSTCTLTGSACNSAANTKEPFTTSGTCTFVGGTSLTVVGNKGDCTNGPSFRNFSIEINNQ